MELSVCFKSGLSILDSAQKISLLACIGIYYSPPQQLLIVFSFLLHKLLNAIYSAINKKNQQENKSDTKEKSSFS